jgi:hypothetical protein
VLYRVAPRLFGELATARGEGGLPRILVASERTRLLIVEDCGLEPLLLQPVVAIEAMRLDRYVARLHVTGGARPRCSRCRARLPLGLGS